MTARAKIAYDAFRGGFCGGETPVPHWDEAPTWVRDAVLVAYLQGRLDNGAVPDMLAALHAAVNWFTPPNDSGAFPLKQIVDAINKAEGGSEREPQSSAEYQHRRGVAWDIVDEALIAYREFMLDDDYDAMTALKTICDRMEKRRALYRPEHPNGSVA